MGKRYRVIGPHVVLGNMPGTEFEAELGEWQEKTLFDTGHIEPATKADAKPQKIACPRCVEEGGSPRTKKYESQEDLNEHYAEKHKGLSVPNLEDLREEEK